VPWGVVLALLTAFAVVLAAGVLVQTAGLLGAAGSWALTALWLQSPRPEGDILVIADPLGVVFLFGGLVVVVAAVVLGMSSDARRTPLRQPAARHR
jgi:Na+/H+ antiporter NhaD/arsenite permease-like protein